MSIVHAIDGVDLVKPLTVQLEDETQGFPTAANLGAFESTNVFIGDPEGALSLHDDIHHIWTSRETTAPSGNRVFFIAYVSPEVRWSRVGGNMVMPVGAGRVWDIDLVESNTLLIRRKIRRDATTTNRPSETVSARVAWVLTTDGMSGVVVDAGLVAASSVVMDPFDYHNQDAASVLRDCANACGFTFSIRYREATEDFELLFFDPVTSAQDLSTLVISNVKSEVDNSTTFAPAGDAKGRFNGDRIASGIVVEKGDGSDVYVTDAGTAAAYAEIDLIAPTPTISQQSTATTFGNSLLTRHATPEQKIEDEIEVDADDVTIVKAGQLIQAKYTHGPGWESGRYARVTRCIPKRPPNLTQGRYRIGLEFQPASASMAAVASHARLMRPRDNDAWTGTYTVDLAWGNDGDDPHAGDESCLPGGVADPATGFLSYNPTPKPGTGWESILVSGTGTLDTVAAKCDFIGVATGPTSALFEILRNDSVIASATASDGTGGAHSQGWDLTASATDVAVVAGDILRARWTVDGSWAGPGQIPSGVGTCDAYLLATGTLLGVP